MFLLTDSQITNERFLIYINDLLASGNIPDLYSPVDEVDGICGAVGNRCKATGVEPTRGNCWDFYIGRSARTYTCPLLQSRRRRFQKSFPEVSRTSKQYSNRLVPALARGRPTQCGPALLNLNFGTTPSSWIWAHLAGELDCGKVHAL